MSVETLDGSWVTGRPSAIRLDYHEPIFRATAHGSGGKSLGSIELWIHSHARYRPPGMMPCKHRELSTPVKSSGRDLLGGHLVASIRADRERSIDRRQ